MLKNSKKFFKAFDITNRENMDVRITINNKVYGINDIFSLTYDSGSMGGEQLEIGSSYSSSVKIVFCRPITTFNELDKVVVELGIKRENFNNNKIGGEVSKIGYAPIGYAPINGYVSEMNKDKADVKVGVKKAFNMRLNRWNVHEEYEYSRMGEFYISEQIDVNWNEKTTTLECSDAIIFTDSAYETMLGFPVKLKYAIREVAENIGLKLDYISWDDLPDITIGKLNGDLTNRQALEKFSQFVAGYAKINRFGYLEIKSFTESTYEIDPNYYFTKGLTKNDIVYQPKGITCTVENDEGSFELHSGSYIGTQISIENNAMTQELLDGVFEFLSTISYYPYSLSWRGNPALEVGDFITVSDLEGNKYLVPNMNYSLEYNGSLSGKSSANTVSTTDIISNNNSPLLKTMNKNIAFMRNENYELSETVKETKQEIDNINKSIEKADLTAIKASIETLLNLTNSIVSESNDDNYDSLNLKVTDFGKIVTAVEKNVNDLLIGTGWLNITLSSGITNSLNTDMVAKAIFRGGEVSMKGSIMGASSTPTILGKVPNGMEPSELQQYNTVIGGDRLAIMEIRTNGDIAIILVKTLIGTGNGSIAPTDRIRIDWSFWKT